VTSGIAFCFRKATVTTAINSDAGWHAGEEGAVTTKRQGRKIKHISTWQGANKDGRDGKLNNSEGTTAERKRPKKSKRRNLAGRVEDLEHALDVLVLKVLLVAVLDGGVVQGEELPIDELKGDGGLADLREEG